MYLCVEYIQSRNSRAKMPDVAPADNVGIEINEDRRSGARREERRSLLVSREYTSDSIFIFARAYGWTICRILKHRSACKLIDCFEEKKYLCFMYYGWLLYFLQDNITWKQRQFVSALSVLFFFLSCISNKICNTWFWNEYLWCNL